MWNVLEKIIHRGKGPTPTEASKKEAEGSSHHYLGDLYYSQGDFLRARSEYKSSLQTSPTDTDAILKMVYCEVAAGNIAGAGQWAVKLNPDDMHHPGYHFAWAAIDRAAGKIPEAEGHLQYARVVYGDLVLRQFMKDFALLFKSRT